MAKIIFVTGGVASGKSTYAVERAKKQKQKVAFVATALPSDREMKRKVKAHQHERPKQWETVEVGNGTLQQALADMQRPFVIIDCLTVYTAGRFMLQKESDQTILSDVHNTIQNLLKNKKIQTCIIVSNEVGMGLVPTHASGRRFRELLGRVNKMVAAHASEAYCLIAGCPLSLKS